MKKVLKLVLIILMVPAALFVIFIAYSSITEYQPDETEILFEQHGVVPTLKKDTLSFLTWNLGFCGLNREMDFFYDGGSKTRPDKDISIANQKRMTSFIASNDTLDFIFLQEVDIEAKRSYGQNHYDSIRTNLPEYISVFGKNFDVFYIPAPVLDPVGNVLSGISVFTKHIPYEAYRRSLPGNYSWPKRIFMLDRCSVILKFKISDDKDLVVLNTHNSAYDDGSLRNVQMTFFDSILKKEYEAGNYVIAGGDWNLNPKGYTNPSKNKKYTPGMIPDWFLPEWKIVYDGSLNTSRSIETTYNPETTPTTLIDFFIVSPNIEAVSIKGIDLGFESTDHQPVIASFVLK